MKRNTFIRSLIGLPFISSALIETVKQNPVEVKKTMGSDLAGIPHQLSSVNPIEGMMCSVTSGTGKDVWIYMSGSWRLMVARAWVDTKENCEPKLTLSDRRA